MPLLDQRRRGCVRSAPVRATGIYVSAAAHERQPQLGLVDLRRQFGQDSDQEAGKPTARARRQLVTEWGQVVGPASTAGALVVEEEAAISVCLDPVAFGLMAAGEAREGRHAGDRGAYVYDPQGMAANSSACQPTG